MTDFKCPHCGGEHPEGTETCPETGEEFTPALAQLGKIIGGKYEILKLLGEGGMGAVYEARHVEIRQHVALKLLHFQLARDQEIRQRFFREAMSAGEIGHENIIQMHDIGRDATGSIYLVMELLKGESLAERVRREGALPVDRAVDIMLQTLDALAASHAKGIVHRDMKPENVFLCRLGGRDDFVKILDFGIAKVKDPADGESLTRTGTMLGTAAYMAPEQIAGDREADHRMDVYACGVILYQMLSGRVPFDATSVHGVIYRIMNEDPPALSEMRQGLPAGVEEIVRRAIARNRDLRFQTAADFAQALVPFGSGRIVPGRGSRVPAAAPAAAAPAALPAAPALSAAALPAAAPPERRSSLGWVALILIPLLLVVVLAIGVVAVIVGLGLISRTSEDVIAASGPDASSVAEIKVEKTYRVEVDTIPSGASIYIDGTLKGEAPLALELPEGITAITAKQEGMPVRTLPCKVEKDGTSRCVISLEPGKEDASTADAQPEVKILEDEPTEEGSKKPGKKKCDPRKNPKCKRLDRD